MNIKEIEIALKNVYGSSDYDMEAGCYSNGSWFSVKAVLEVIRDIDRYGVDVAEYVENLDDEDVCDELGEKMPDEDDVNYELEMDGYRNTLIKQLEEEIENA